MYERKNYQFAWWCIIINQGAGHSLALFYPIYSTYTERKIVNSEITL
jgi:hypothetical protein